MTLTAPTGYPYGGSLGGPFGNTWVVHLSLRFLRFCMRFDMANLCDACRFWSSDSVDGSRRPASLLPMTPVTRNPVRLSLVVRRQASNEAGPRAFFSIAPSDSRTNRHCSAMDAAMVGSPKHACHVAISNDSSSPSSP